MSALCVCVTSFVPHGCRTKNTDTDTDTDTDTHITQINSGRANTLRVSNILENELTVIPVT